MNTKKVVQMEQAELEAIASLAESAARVVRELPKRKGVDGNGERAK